MGSISVGERNSMLNAATGRANYTATPVYVQLHTGDPGANGTANVAANSTRVQATFGTDATTGSIANTADVLFAALANVETVTYVSMWSASTAGTFKGSDDIASTPIAVGDNVRIPAGSLTLALT